MSEGAWRRCSSCKNDIGFGQTYWACSVSTCNQKRTGLYFCSVSCWEAHLPLLRHREAYALERRAPTAAQARDEDDEAPPPRPVPRATADKPPPHPVPRATADKPPPHPVPRATADKPPPRPDRPPAAAIAAAPAVAPAERRRVIEEEDEGDLPEDILIVASKLKKYIRARSGMNTSDAVLEVLSDHVRKLCDQAIRNAGAAERKTVLDRDFPHP